MITAPVWPSREEQRGQQERQCDLNFLLPKPDGSALPTRRVRSLAHSRCSFLRGVALVTPLRSPGLFPGSQCLPWTPGPMPPTVPIQHGAHTANREPRADASVEWGILSRQGVFSETSPLKKFGCSLEFWKLEDPAVQPPSSCVWEIPSPDRGFAQPHRLSNCKASAGSAPAVPAPPRPRCPPRGCCRANAAGEKPESLQHAVMETVGQGPTQCGHSWSPLEGSLQDSGGRLCPERLPVASCLVPSSPAAAKGYWAPPAGHQEHVLQDEDRKLPGTTDTQRFAKRQCWDAGGQC